MDGSTRSGSGWRRGGLADPAAVARSRFSADLFRLVRLDRDGHRAIVESATPLPDDLRIDVQTGLARAYGQGLDTSFEVNPRLIGGMRIRVGSDVYDASVLAKLAALEARL